jgi:hypothetical protein
MKGVTKYKYMYEINMIKIEIYNTQNNSYL